MQNWKSNILWFGIIFAAIFFATCAVDDGVGEDVPAVSRLTSQNSGELPKNEVPVIYVLVALCDNENQGIVPVPGHLGNGEDPARNLYWGAAYGVETYFAKSALWNRLPDPASPKNEVLKRIAFEHRKTGAILIADAYRGIDIKTSISDFLKASAGDNAAAVEIDGKTLHVGGGADILVYVGHNGLMDFKISKPAVNERKGERDAIVLACFSKKYFGDLLKDTGTDPVLWTTNLMAPEAYIVHDALEGRLAGENNEQIRERGARAYAKYQKISLKASKGLFVTGW